MQLLKGYTVALWMKIIPPISSKSHVYLSNGGHSDKNHGVAMLYDKGLLQMKFKDKVRLFIDNSNYGIYGYNESLYVD